ncbi:hypothetical protein [Staphylococcus haemolyticus]|uniref:hypothetical protein n=1 Tax=Staphylococcus haemolyticus TaxID=1283 RepID=UPI0015D72253|nr:hypothetical protein [Staphylococcus haemolyticus]
MRMLEDKFLESSKLIRHSRLHEGIQYIFKDSEPNKYFSVVRHGFSYGSEEGLYELAKCEQVDGYNRILDDPIGWLSANKVLEIVERGSDE